MKNLLCLIVSLIVAGALLTSALALSQAQPVGGVTTTTTIRIAPAEKKAEVKSDLAKRPTIKFKVFEKKAETKKEEINKEAAKRAVRVQVIERAIGRVAVAPGEPNPQVLQQYRPMLWAEYHLARSVCELTPEQRKVIAREAEHAFQEAVAKSGLNPQLGRPIRLAGGANQTNEPDDSIREDLIKAVKDNLKPDQAAKYQQELDKRTAHRRRISVDNIVAKIDESLILTTEQRNKLRELLVANWKVSWCPSPESLLMNAQMLPQIPDQFIVPVLNEAQKSIWRGLNKYARAHFRSIGFMANNMMGGDSPEDDALRKAREAEAKARDKAKAKRETVEKREGNAKNVDDAKPNAKMRGIIETKEAKAAK